MGEKLEESGEEPEVRRHHAGFFLELAERVEPLINGKDRGFWLERLDAEHDNFRAALAWSREEAEGETALRLSGALCRGSGTTASTGASGEDGSTGRWRSGRTPGGRGGLQSGRRRFPEGVSGLDARRSGHGALSTGGERGTLAGSRRQARVGPSAAFPEWKLRVSRRLLGDPPTQPERGSFLTDSA